MSKDWRYTQALNHFLSRPEGQRFAKYHFGITDVDEFLDRGDDLPERSLPPPDSKRKYKYNRF